MSTQSRASCIPDFLLLTIILLSLISVGSARVIEPTIYEQKNIGDIKAPELLYSISADCEASTIDLQVLDRHLNPVGGAWAYLSYVDFSSPTFAREQAGPDGRIKMKLPGNTSYMRGVFMLVLEKKGYSNREVHFGLTPCYSKTNPSPTTPAIVPANPMSPATPAIPTTSASPRPFIPGYIGPTTVSWVTWVIPAAAFFGQVQNVPPATGTGQPAANTTANASAITRENGQNQSDSFISHIITQIANLYKGLVGN